jgi:hypothetical protein
VIDELDIVLIISLKVKRREKILIVCGFAAVGAKDWCGPEPG